jgi:hypothetical protein
MVFCDIVDRDLFVDVCRKTVCVELCSGDAGLKRWFLSPNLLTIETAHSEFSIRETDFSEISKTRPVSILPKSHRQWPQWLRLDPIYNARRSPFNGRQTHPSARASHGNAPSERASCHSLRTQESIRRRSINGRP